MALRGKIAVRRTVTIFGYNTDIRHGNTVFHVQTEVRENELTMQSAIFVRGRCIGKHSVSYAAESQTPEFGEPQIHQLVTQQHRFVVNTIREGRLDALLAGGEQPSGPSGVSPQVAVPVAAPSASGMGPVSAADSQTCACSVPAKAAPEAHEELTLEWLPEGVVWASNQALMRFRVMLGGRRMQGARIISRIQCAGCAPAFAEGMSDSQGEAELVHSIGAASASTTSQCTMLVKVSAGQRSVTRKFRLERK